MLCRFLATIRINQARYAGSTPNIVTTDTTAEEFATASSITLTTIQDRLDSDDVEDREIADFDISDGVLKVSVRGSGAWVLNTQRFTRQLWLSSPIRSVFSSTPSTNSSKQSSGPGKFNWHRNHNQWLHERDSSIRLQKILEMELGGAIMGKGVVLKFDRDF